ncbi:MAG: crossover junction endodeoxyribonuclease RuvC [Phycisphaerae bacterium]|nr:crossover junction endodeoxyribonuclease RuvC [Phycisphaerae bacterium]
MIVVAIDPGLRTSGYAVVSSIASTIKVIDAGTIKADPKAEMAYRIQQIYNDIAHLLSLYDADVLAIEQLYSHYKFPKTSILMGHARAMFLLAAAQKNIPVVDYAATKIKKSLTGNGRASKSQMQHAIASQLGLIKIPEPADVADALAIALCCINYRKDEMPESV